MRTKKICFVVQRYGLEVNGGAELLCRQLAERLVPEYGEVHVLTTKAVDYMTWHNEYPLDEEDINGVRVHRFTVTHDRDVSEFNKLNSRYVEQHEAFDYDTEREWIEKQGPVVPELIEYLKEHHFDFDAFIFVTYLYYPTVAGLKEVADRAILLPCAHDEPFIHMQHYRELFLAPKGIFYNTSEEKEMVERLFGSEGIRNEIGGAGADIPEDIDPQEFRDKYGADNFMIYVGRIDQSKNCGELFGFFRTYKERNQSDLKLVLIGKPVMDIPDDPDIINLGFVSDRDKFNAIAAARMLVIPSLYESLSMVVLEAMRVGTNVLVNAGCEVLRGHCTKSNGALFYNGYFEFEGMVNYYLYHPFASEQMRQNAYAYVNDNYRWDVIIEKLCGLIEYI